MANAPHLLVVDAPYYTEISKSLMAGVTEVLDAENATHDYVTVPGVLEIPAAVSMAMNSTKQYDGYVVLGCVIRGETTHYEICLLYTSPSPRDRQKSRMPSSA